MKNLPPKNIVYVFEDYRLDTKQKLLFCDGEIVPLGQKSYECLLLLLKNAGNLVTKETFFDEIWQDSFVEDGVLAVNISFLRKTFGEIKDKPKFIETFSRKGYRFIPKVNVEIIGDFDENQKEFVNQIDNNDKELSNKLYLEQTKTINTPTKLDEVLESSNNTTPSKTPKLIIPNESPKEKSWWSKLKFVEFFILIGIAGIASFLVYKKYSYIPAPKIPQKVSVAIFPFNNYSGKDELNYLSLGFTDSLNYSLAPIAQARTVPTTSLKNFAGKTFDPTEEGKKLAVDNVITGNYNIDNEKIIVEVQISGISNNVPILQRQIFESQLSDLAAIRSGIFKFLVSGLNLNRTDEELLEIQQLETSNPKAYEFYLKGSNAYFNTQFDEAISFYERAVEFDPNFVPALEGLATNYLQKGSIAGCGAPCYKKSIEYFEKVVQIAPRYERVQLNLAISYVDSNQIDKAIPLIKGVMSKNPDNKHSYFCLSYAYRYAGMLDEAAKFLERSKTTDNKDTSFADIPISYIYQQEYEKFLLELNVPTNNSYGLFYRGLANYYLKNYEIAKQMFDDSYRMSPNTLTERIAKIYSLHLEKNETAAIKLANEIRYEIIKNQVNDGEMIYKIAQAFSQIKQTKEALELFKLAVDKGFFCYPFFNNDPLMENIRKNSEFETTLKKAQDRHQDFKIKFMNDNQTLLSLKKAEIVF